MPIPVTTSGGIGTVTLSASGLPSGLSFTDNGDGTGSISGTVAEGASAASPYMVTVTATDTAGQEDTETFDVTVNVPATVGLQLDGSGDHFYLDGNTPWTEVPGELDLRADVAADDWTPTVARFVATVAEFGASLRRYRWRLNTNGTLGLSCWDSDTAAWTAYTNSSTAPTVTDGDRLQLRVTVDIGASDTDIIFYTRAAGTDLSVNTGWTQLGTTQSLGFVLDFADGSPTDSHPTRLGYDVLAPAQSWKGAFYGYEVKQGINGTTRAAFDVDDGTAGDAGAVQYADLNGTNEYYRLGTALNFPVFTGDHDFRLDIALDDWTPASQQQVWASYNSVGNGRWACFVNSDGTLDVRINNSARGLIGTSSSVAPTVADGERLQWRCAVDVNNGASGIDQTYYTRDPALGLDLADNSGWVQLGTVRTTGGGAFTPDAGDSTTAVIVGAWELSGVIERFTSGKIYGLVAIDVGKGIISRFDPNLATINAASTENIPNPVGGSEWEPFNTPAIAGVAADTITDAGTSDVWVLYGDAEVA